MAKIDCLDSLTLEDVLDREGIDYRIGHGSSGEQLNIHECPFCGGSSWKVYASRDTGLGNCFHGSCGKTFNIPSFVMALNGTGFGEAVKYLEALARDLGWRSKRAAPSKADTEENEDWKLPDNFSLPLSDGRTLDYLRQRRVDDDTTRYFDLRYCMSGWFNYTKPDGDRGGMYFGDRVLIPVYDLDGTMVTFQGRDITGESDRKYLFPPGLPGTGRYLFNGQNAVGRKQIIMCEGAFDVIRTWVNIQETEFADHAVVGSFGIHLSTGQDGADQKNKFLTLKGEGLEEVTVFWDGEPAAFKKAVKAANQIAALGLKVYVTRPPDGKDPGDLSVVETDQALQARKRVTRQSSLMMRLGSM